MKLNKVPKKYSCTQIFFPYSLYCIGAEKMKINYNECFNCDHFIIIRIHSTEANEWTENQCIYNFSRATVL